MKSKLLSISTLFLVVGFMFFHMYPEPAFGEKIVIELSTTVAPGSTIDLAADKFKTLVEKQSNGRVSVVRYRAGQLYGPKAQIEAIAKGGLSMAVLHMAYVGARSPALEFISSMGAQGCWADYDHYWRFIDLPDTRRVAETEFEVKMNAKLLGILSYGTGIIGNRKKPIHTVEDYKGIKIRAAGTSGATFLWALGMVPTELSAKEVYMALQRGTIDGSVSGPDRFLKSKWYEVATYLTQDYSLPYISMWLVINSDFWNKLDKDNQQIISESAIEVEKWTRTYAKAETEKSYKELRSLVKDLYFMPKTETAKINEMVRPKMHNLIVKRAGKEMGEKLWSLFLEADKIQ